MANEQDKKLESQLKDLTSERSKIEKEILDLKSKTGDLIKTSVSDTEKLLKLEALRLGNVEKEEELRKKIEKIDIDSRERLKETLDDQEKNTSTIKEQNDLTKELQLQHKRITSFGKDMVENQSQSSALIKAINGDSAKTEKYVNDQKLAYSLIGDSLQSIHTIQGGTVDQQFKFANAQMKNADLAEDLLGIENKLQLAKEKGTGSQFQAIDLSQMALDLRVRESDLENNKANMTAEQYAAGKKTLDLLKGRFKDIQNENNALQKQADTINLIGEGFDAIGLNAGAIINKLPGGDKINKIMGIDKTANEMKKKFGEALKSGLDGNFKDAFKQGLGGLKSMISLAPKFLAALGIGLLLGAVNFLVGAIGKVDEEAAAIGQEFGITRKESFKLRDATVDIANQMNLVGINSKEVVKGIKTTSEIMGGIDIAGQIASGNKQAQQLVKDVTVLSEKFELSQDEIKGIQTLSAMTGKSMGQLTKEATTLGKGIMTSKESLKALAKIPPSVTVAFKGGTQELIKAAQKAQALGHDLKKVQDIGDGLMDIESSLNKEMEARVLTGKNIQLDKARELALNGDIAGLQDELLHQAGSLGEYQKMNRLAQKSMAEAMGMSVEEMTEMLTNAEKLKNLGISQERMSALQAMNAAELNAELAKGGSAQLTGYIQQLAKEKESAEIKKRMSDALEKVQEKLSKILTPLLEMAHGFLDTLTSGEQLDETVNTIKGVLMGIIPTVKTIFGVFSGILGFAMKIFGFLFKSSESTGEMKAGFGSILPILGAIGMYFGAKGLLTTGMSLLKDKALDVGKTMMSSIGGAAKSLGGKLLSGSKGVAGKVAGKIAGKGGGLMGKLGKAGGKAASAAGKAKGGGPLANLARSLQDLDGKKLLQIAAAILVLAAALYVSAKGFQEMAKVDWKKAYVGVLIFSAMVAALIITAMLLKDPVTFAVLETLAATMVGLGIALLLAAMGFKIMGEIKWNNFKGIAGALIELAAGFTVLGLASVFIIEGSFAMMAMGAAAAIFGAGLLLIATALQEFTKIGDFKKVGDNLAAGMTALASVSDKIDLGKLEDAFDDLEDALEELDFEQLAAFGQLGNAALKQAGENLVAGINSLVGINDKIDWARIETTFDLLEDALDELDLDGIKAFGELGKEGITQAGKNLIDGINSFGSIDLSILDKSLSQITPIFGKIRDSFSELTGGWFESNPLEKIAEMKLDSLPTFGKTISDFLKSISEIKQVTSLDILKDQFESLSDAIDELDIDKLNELSNIKAESMKNLLSLQSVFQPSQAVQSNTGGGSESGQGGGAAQTSSPFANMEKKLDTLISIIGDAASKPSVIKIGEKTIEEIKSHMDFRKAYTIAVDNSYGRKIQT